MPNLIYYRARATDRLLDTGMVDDAARIARLDDADELDVAADVALRAIAEHRRVVVACAGEAATGRLDAAREALTEMRGAIAGGIR